MTRIGYRVLTLMLLLAFTVPAAAQSLRLMDEPPSREGSGNYFLKLGEREFTHGRPRRAFAHWELSAFWGHKIAQYNLGLMYFKGVGVGRDRARGLAWLTLAAERGDVPFVKALEWCRTQLGPDDLARARSIVDELSPRYADAVALPRAQTIWMLDSRMSTGSHIGMPIGPLVVYGPSGEEDGMNRQRHLQQRGPYTNPLYPRVEVGDLRSLESRP
jgi:hypothetical protein